MPSISVRQRHGVLLLARGQIIDMRLRVEVGHHDVGAAHGEIREPVALRKSAEWADLPALLSGHCVVRPDVELVFAGDSAQASQDHLAPRGFRQQRRRSGAVPGVVGRHAARRAQPDPSAEQTRDGRQERDGDPAVPGDERSARRLHSADPRGGLGCGRTCCRPGGERCRRTMPAVAARVYGASLGCTQRGPAVGALDLQAFRFAAHDATPTSAGGLPWPPTRKYRLLDEVIPMASWERIPERLAHRHRVGKGTVRTCRTSRPRRRRKVRKEKFEPSPSVPPPSPRMLPSLPWREGARGVKGGGCS